MFQQNVSFKIDINEGFSLKACCLIDALHDFNFHLMIQVDDQIHSVFYDIFLNFLTFKNQLEIKTTQSRLKISCHIKILLSFLVSFSKLMSHNF